jgi:hypothetical protein
MVKHYLSMDRRLLLEYETKATCTWHWWWIKRRAWLIDLMGDQSTILLQNPRPINKPITPKVKTADES